MTSPMSNEASFVEANKDFVLKLKFTSAAGDVSEIRRVKLPRIGNDKGQVCYDELVGLAISFVFPENPVNASDFEVKLTYKDVDRDTVVIGSSEELVDAIDQFSEQRVLRLKAEVKRYTRAKALPQQQSMATQTSSRASATEDTSSEEGTAEASSQPNDTTTTSGNAHPMLQSVVESVVNIILNAAVKINGQGNHHEGQAEPPLFYTPDGVPSDGSEANKTSNDPVPESNGNEASQTEREAESDPSQNNDSPTEEEETNQPEDPVEEPSAEPKPAEKPMEEPLAEEDLPFIHGRHTCDVCLTTPIIGKRYHAVNMSDYDLCEKCYSNYKGSEIKFEPVELERDLHLQNRWNRRRERMNRKGFNGGGRRRFGPPFRPPGHHQRWGPGPHRGGPRGHPPPPPPFHPPPHGPHGHPPPPPFRPPHHGPRGFRGPPFPPPPGPPPFPHPYHPLRKDQDDLAMETAIRLSMQDMEKKAPTPSAVANMPETKETVEAEDASLDQKQAATKSVPSAPTEDEIKEEQLEKSLSDGEEDEIQEEQLEKSLSDGEKESSKEADAVEVETVEDDDAEEEEVSVKSDHVEVQKPADGSFASGASEIKNVGSEASPAKAKEEPSFSSDAEGNGDVAESLGITLDMCARAIDAMVLELDRTASGSSHSVTSSYVGVNDEPEEESAEEESAEEENDVEDQEESGSEEEEANAVAETEGATIIESADGAPNKESSVDVERSDEDWQVVTEDQQIVADAELARAAQMIGSALFNSDMRSSGEMMSTLTGSAAESDAISFASSVPTSVPSVAGSHVSAAQRDRWASQLAQLRSMGFDDARCVDVLERLTAANIGCGSDDEVSVEQVINELWKN